MSAAVFVMDESTTPSAEARRAWFDRSGAVLAGAIAGTAAASRFRRPSATGAFLAACSPLLLGIGALSAAGLVAAGRRAAGWRVLAATTTAAGLRRRATRPVVVARGRTEEPHIRSVTIPLRLVTVNLSNDTAGRGPLPEEITLSVPDVVVLQEVTPGHMKALEESAGRLGLVYREVRTDRGHCGLGVWSRFGLSGAQWHDIAGEPQLRCWVDLPDGNTLRLIVVHAPSPVPQKVERWRSWFAAMSESVGAELACSDGPLVMAGDFNATSDHLPFRRLLDVGLLDAVPDLREGWPMTWSTRWWPVPPLFRIDHVLVSRGVRVSRSRAGRAARSDHRSLLVDLDVRRLVAPLLSDRPASSIPAMGQP